jgi:hypothetical protein
MKHDLPYFCELQAKHGGYEPVVAENGVGERRVPIFTVRERAEEFGRVYLHSGQMRITQSGSVDAFLDKVAALVRCGVPIGVFDPVVGEGRAVPLTRLLMECEA